MMKFSSTWKVFIIISLTIFSIECRPSIKCLAYLLQLKSYYQTNKGLFLKQMAPYLIYSGKQMDDMGFPKLCLDNQLAYTTVKVDSFITDKHITQHPDFLFSFYYGFCFTDVCSVKDLNDGGKFIIEDIFEDSPLKISTVTFYDTQLQPEFSAFPIILMILFSAWIVLGFVGLLCKWFKQCGQKQNQKVEISIPLQQSDKKVDQPVQQKYQQPINNKFFKSISIGRKWYTLWTPQNSTKIPQFSTFKILSIPFIIYGYFFYLCNYGSFNIFAFNQEIYQGFYSQVATFAYYIPDIFFFISGFLLTKNVFTQVQFAGNKTFLLIKKLYKKFLRLYPIYIVCLLIFWFIVPSLHAGPVWSIYKQHQIDQCNSLWWSNILMIGNFFSDGCFNYSWWVQVEFQYTVLALLNFALLFTNKSIGTILLYIQLLASWVLLFVFSEKLPVQLQITVNDASSHYFKSFHSHLPFYLTGVVMALIFKKESTKRFVINYYFKNFIVLVLGIAAALAIFLLILIRPSTFSYDSLNIQLALCRTGILYCFIIYCLPGFIKQRTNKTIKHKIAQLSYPIILIAGVIVGASYWGLQSFPYTSGSQLLYNLIPNLILSVLVGIALHILFNFLKPRKQEPHVI